MTGHKAGDVPVADELVVAEFSTKDGRIVGGPSVSSACSCQSAVI